MKRVLFVLLALFTLTACQGGPAAQSPALRLALGPSGAYPTIVATGDISPPSIGAQKATSDLVIRLNPWYVLTLGDNQYNSGSLSAYHAYYDPTWGRFKDRTFSAPGNHEYLTSGATGYFSYFNAARIYRAIKIGDWLLLQLDSNRAMSVGSAQYNFVRDQLAANASTKCVLAYWHHPRWSSGTKHGSNPTSAPIWSLLYQNRADVVLVGHEHNYERFALKDPSGAVASDGIREFVSGLGGKSRYSFGAALRGSQRRYNSAYGVLELGLMPTSYSWRFVSVDNVVRDQGSANCV